MKRLSLFFVLLVPLFFIGCKQNDIIEQEQKEFITLTVDCENWANNGSNYFYYIYNGEIYFDPSENIQPSKFPCLKDYNENELNSNSFCNKYILEKTDYTATIVIFSKNIDQYNNITYSIRRQKKIEFNSNINIYLLSNEDILITKE